MFTKFAALCSCIVVGLFLCPEGSEAQTRAGVSRCHSDNAFISPDSKFVYLVEKSNEDEKAQYSSFSLAANKWSHGSISNLLYTNNLSPNQFRELGYFFPLSNGQIALKKQQDIWGVFDTQSGDEIRLTKFESDDQLTSPNSAKNNVRIKNIWYPRMQRVVGSKLVSHQVFSRNRRPDNSLNGDAIGEIKVFDVVTGEIITHTYDDEDLVGWVLMPNGNWVGKYVKEGGGVFFSYFYDGKWNEVTTPVDIYTHFLFPNSFGTSGNLLFSRVKNSDGVLSLFIYAVENGQHTILPIDNLKNPIGFSIGGDSLTAQKFFLFEDGSGTIDWGTHQTWLNSRSKKKSFKLTRTDWSENGKAILLSISDQVGDQFRLELWKYDGNSVDICNSFFWNYLKRQFIP